MPTKPNLLSWFWSLDLNSELGYLHVSTWGAFGCSEYKNHWNDKVSKGPYGLVVADSPSGPSPADSSSWAASWETTVIPEGWGSWLTSPLGVPSGMMTSPCFCGRHRELVSRSKWTLQWPNTVEWTSEHKSNSGSATQVSTLSCSQLDWQVTQGLATLTSWLKTKAKHLHLY